MSCVNAIGQGDFIILSRIHLHFVQVLRPSMLEF